MMGLREKLCVLDVLQAGMSYSPDIHEFNINESTINIM